MLILETLLPIFGLIVIGALFRRFGFPGDAFWLLADRLTYYALLPSLLFHHLSTASFQGLHVLAMAGSMVLALLFVTFSLLLLQPWLEGDRPRFTSVFQGSIRPNSYIGIAAGGALYGDQGLALTAVAIAAVIPLVNLLSVVVLAYYVSRQPESIRPLFNTVIRNPLIIACLLGVAVNSLKLPVPQVLVGTLRLFGLAALPLGLLSVGSGLVLNSIARSSFSMAVASLGKLAAVPLATAVACALLGVDGAPRTIAVMYAALPGSASSYILAIQMGGDARLMAAIITAETVASMLTLPMILNLLL